ncbi:MAG TPA: HD domain-containing phosphohydrolase, partial [Candidatus Lustribacter sp.]|nr:HD domain-containing phosphohydrolase [Candidatus Lustribacter sp.]
GRAHLDEMMLRALTVGWAGLLYRDISFGGATLVRWDAMLGTNRWLSAMAMVVVSGTGFLLYVAGAGLVASSREHTPLGPTIRDEFQVAFGVTSALSATGALIALAARPVGLLALPLYLVPLLLTQFAVRRQGTISETYRQTIRTLSHMTDVGGYTSPGHAERVADLSLSVGRAYGMRERDLRDLEFAALLHDVGQVALFEPIPGGATVLAAPADQRRIAADGAQIVRETGVLKTVVEILEAQTHQYRQVREFGEVLPLESRIIKVVNAFDDLTGGSRDRVAEDAAVERIYLGLGYEYDPGVVEALRQVLARRH